jgi:DNA repair protein RadC
VETKREVKNMSIHAGHRKRLRQRFLEEGLDNFDEINALELLLFYCIPQKDTNPIAHDLLDRFGSLPQVLEATPEELMSVDGISEYSVTFLKLITAAGRYYQVKRAETGEILRTISQCGNYLVPRFYGRENETVFLLCLDAKCKVLGCKLVGEGSVNSANIPIRRVVEIALNSNATTVILAHNHPSGLALPSDEDVETTIRVAKAMEAVEITLADHIVVADNDYVSMVQSGYFRPGFGDYL